MFETEFEVDWADCDPAGIVFYPHFFRFMDTALQRLLRARGLTQAVFRGEFGSIGTPLLEANARFRSPARPGDRLTIRVSKAEWRGRAFRLDYRASIAERLVFEGFETRICAAEVEGRLQAIAAPERLRAALG